MSATLINLYRQAEDYFFRGIAVKCMDLGDGANAYLTGGAELNFIYITRKTNSLDKILIAGKQFYDQDTLSFDVMIPEALCTPQIADVLNTLGYQQKSQSVSMALNLETFTIDHATNLDDETAIQANDNQLNEWMMPLISAYESTFEICSIYARTHANALKKGVNLRHFSLYKEEKSIASITLSMHDTIARIDDVGTVSQFQGKGYATHLLRYALSKAKQFGARHCFLESSDDEIASFFC